MKTLTVLIFSTWLFLFSASEFLLAQSFKDEEIDRGEPISLPAVAPDKNALNPPSFRRLTIWGRVVGTAVLYDDPKTRRSADYLELYDSAGQLVAVSWFDRFGIRRTAIDRGLLEEARDLEGVFVVLPEGEPS